MTADDFNHRLISAPEGEMVEGDEAEKAAELAAKLLAR